MIEYIYIPTLGRSDKQVTYNSLPDEWKEKTILVVQKHEEEIYKERCGDEKIFALPGNITTIAPTREYIVKMLGGKSYFCMFDDDLKFYKTRMSGETEGPGKTLMTDDDFTEMFTQMFTWLQKDVIHCALDLTWNPPDRDNSYKENTRICGNVFYNGFKLPKDIEWARIPIQEDMDVNLQLLRSGYANRVSNVWRIDPGQTQTDGGCKQSGRTLELHNMTQHRLQQLHKPYVKVVSKVAKNSGEWSGEKKLSLRVDWKGAFNSSKVNTLDNFFA